MKKILFALSLVVFIFSACTKKQSSILPPPEIDTVYIDSTKPVDTSLTIAGISDIRTSVWDKQILSLIVSRNIGAEQKVTMSVAGIPSNVEAEFSAPSGYTTFNTTLTVNTMFAKPGIYPLTIASNTEKGKTTDYKVNLVIDSLSPLECNNLFMSMAYYASNTKDVTNDSTIWYSTGATFNIGENQLYLRSVVLSFDTNPAKFFLSHNSVNTNFNVKFSVSCEDGTITIPEQTTLGRSSSGGFTKMFKISGTGKIRAAEKTYSITYVTEHDDNGTTVTKSYKVDGNLGQ